MSFAAKAQRNIGLETAHIPQLVVLCAQHAEFEHTPFAEAGKATALGMGLFSNPPRLYGWVAVANATLIGYATASSEYSTWSAGEYLHVDCLFVARDHRNEGVGKALFASVMAFAFESRYAQVQWQTPHWNREARRFYLRQGAAEQEKRRFFWIPHVWRRDSRVFACVEVGLINREGWLS